MNDDIFYDFLERHGVGQVDCNHKQWDKILDLRNQIADFIEQARKEKESI